MFIGKKVSQGAYMIIARTLISTGLAFIMMAGCSPGGIDSDKKAHKDSIGLVLRRNTSLRIDPYIFSGRITQMKKGDTVTVHRLSAKKSWIGKSHDYWYKVTTSNNLTGWSYGKNIKLLKGKDAESITEYVNDFWEEETKKMRKEIEGKWWSQNSFGDFTRHALEFSPDGRYKSYMKAANPHVHEGIYTIDFNKQELIFLKGASFGNKLEFNRMGQSYVLKKELKVGDMTFKKIAIETSIEPEKGKKQKKKDGAKKNNKKSKKKKGKKAKGKEKQ